MGLAAIVCGMMLCFNSAPVNGPMQAVTAHVRSNTLAPSSDPSLYVMPQAATMVQERPGKTVTSSGLAAPYLIGLLLTSSCKMSTTAVSDPGFQTLQVPTADMLT